MHENYPDNDTTQKKVEEMKQSLVGRQKERRFFTQLLRGRSNLRHIMNLFGTGGVGKTSLLIEFRRLCRKDGRELFILDSRVIPRTPREFCLHLLRSLNYPMHSLKHHSDDGIVVRSCLDFVRSLINQKGLIIAFDTFEEIGEMETWLQHTFLNEMPPKALIIISGRFPLQPSWFEVPVWKQVIHRFPLEELDYDSVKVYLNRSGITKEDMIQQIWEKTKGHPLTLALLTSTELTQTLANTDVLDEREIFAHIVQSWLKETSDSEMLMLVETAAVVRRFNQELLSYIMERPVETEEFRRLISYSFVQFSDPFWMLHELLREAILQDLRLRTPDRYNRLWKHCVLYYSDQLKESAKNKTISSQNVEFLYYIGNHFIQFLTFKDSVSYNVEPLSSANWEETEQYIQERRRTVKDNYIDFINKETNERVHFEMPKKASLDVLNQIRFQELYELDKGCVKLLRNSAGKLYGMMEIIPIKRKTMAYLLSKPLSRAYFNHLTETERQELMVDDNQNSGIFVKVLDVFDFGDSEMMQAANSTLINHILTSGYVVVAPHFHPISKIICTGLGLEEVQGVVHYDYDGYTPSSYYFMDTRGNKVHEYVNKMISSFGLDANALKKEQEQLMEILTSREQEIVRQVLKGIKNQEIAQKLYLSEITVKKHLTKIYQKFEVKNRSQLILKIVGAV